ncbi:Gfo/Idh/MocA family protein [Demequina sp.]|uniref:Gfo/Idh/MocA family protein n=1 Tax=Demequina sp. TaxID=2050685 RepID=UPI003D106D9E
MTAPLPHDAPAIRWGILGAGGIAHKLAQAVNQHTASKVTAVASRTPGKAQAFADAEGVQHAFTSYEDLVNSQEVDAIYVATTHNDHHTPALLAINAGIPTLVEKAFTQNAAQARQVIDAAAANNTYVQEAMWTRWLPHIAAVREAIQRGDIGEIVTVQADHGQPIAHVDRMKRPDLAGGALLDLGIYPVSFAFDILGAPDKVTAVGQLTDAGVDGQVSMVFDYGHEGSKAQASLTTTMWARTPCQAVIAGTEGRIEIADTFYAPSTWRLIRKDGTSWEFDGRVDNGFQYEAAALARNVAQGLTEAPELPLHQTLTIMETLDEIRSQIGVVYPGE